MGCTRIHMHFVHTTHTLGISMQRGREKLNAQKIHVKTSGKKSVLKVCVHTVENRVSNTAQVYAHPR